MKQQKHNQFKKEYGEKFELFGKLLSINNNTLDKNPKYKNFKNKKLRNAFIQSFLIILIISNFPHLINNSKSERKLNSFLSEITMEIFGEIGEKRIVRSENNQCPDEIYINNSKIAERSCTINLEKNENIIIKMIWLNPLTSCQNLFYAISNIIYVDLSKFDFSLVVSMQSMFSMSGSIKSINFGNINTSFVTDMSYLFFKVHSLESIDLSKFDTSKVKNIDQMFGYCGLLKSLNLSNFDTSSVLSMQNVFFWCNSLISLDLSNFNTSQTIRMDSLFEHCISLKYLNISNFDTKSVESMEKMFDTCESLENLDLSNFNTKSVENMEGMFFTCSSLKYLNISNFDTSNVRNMKFMFSNCNSLKYLDLSNFNTSLVTTMFLMFKDCFSLTSLNIISFNTSLVYDMGGMFKGCRSLKSIELSNINTTLAESTVCFFEECYSITSLNLSGFITKNNKNFRLMFNSCFSLLSLDLSNFDTSLVTEMGYMFNNCSSLTTLNLSNFNTNLVTEIDYMFNNCSSLTTLYFSNFNTTSVNKMINLFSLCSSLISLNLSHFDTSFVSDMNGIFQGCSSLKYLDVSKFNTSITEKMNNMFADCISLKSLDISNFDTSLVLNMSHMFENCELLESLNLSKFDTSKVNDMSFMFHNCINLQYINLENAIESNALNTNNALEFIPNNIIYCINEENTPKINELFKEKKNSRKDCSIDWKNNSLNNIYLNNFFLEKYNINNSNIENREIIGQSIINDIMDGSMDSLLSNIINNNKNYIIKEEKQIYQITSLTNQKKYSDDDITIVNLGKCEKKLKEDNGIDENEELIIFKIDTYLPGFNIPMIEYVIFSQDGKIKFDLSSCNGIPIQYQIPISINKSELFKYDSSSTFYNDECSQYTTDHGTDMTLYDRKNEYNDNNLSLCEANCEFKGYSYNSLKLKVECECKIKKEMNFFSDIHIDKKKLINQFINVKKITNIWVIKCINLFFSVKGVISNIGFYTLSAIIIINVIISILFYRIGYHLLSEQIKQIINKKFSLSIDNKKINLPPKRKGKKKRKSSKSYKRASTQNDILLTTNIINTNTNSNNKEKDEKEMNNFNDYELNSLSYEEALNYDHRTYFQYYLSLIKTKQLIVFTFFISSDYNSKIIKISLFFFSFGLFYIINALFFNDSTIHKIYEDQGAFNFIYQLPQILYSTIISVAIKTILGMLSLTEKNIIEIKQQETFEKANDEMKKKRKYLLIKFILFFILSFIFLILFLFYISCFCAVYKNTQLYLIKDTIISFCTSLIYPFIINLLPGLLRIPSLKEKNKSCIYKISKVIQLI